MIQSYFERAIILFGNKIGRRTIPKKSFCSFSGIIKNTIFSFQN